MIPRLSLVLAILLNGAAMAQSQEPAPLSLEGLTWTQQKCRLYESAFKDAVEIQGAEGLRPAFLQENADFIAAGCTTKRPICPETAQEGALADLLTVLTMNEGMASTFVPFACR